MVFDNGVIEKVEPRSSYYPRTNVANVTLINIVIAPLPEPDYLLVDKLIAEAYAGGAKVTLTVNKADTGLSVFNYCKENYSNAVDAIFSVSAETGEGIDELVSYLNGNFTAFAGQSAVGKTSLINRIFGTDKAVNSLSEKTLRGRHTTTSREIHFADGLAVIDTPGFSSLELTGVKSDELDKLYKEFTPYVGKCYYIGCSHTAEPDCLIKDAVSSGGISSDRYSRYLSIYKEIKENEKHRY
ncbi:MAG: ribosome small subunit-dependent GTPase A [Clostridia bacterium]|nr:ribosome small subunit-dependent GTPase A [Clostridia bacterium]